MGNTGLMLQCARRGRQSGGFAHCSVCVGGLSSRAKARQKANTLHHIAHPVYVLMGKLETSSQVNKERIDRYIRFKAYSWQSTQGEGRG